MSNKKTKGCANCGGPFGMVRKARWGKQFCSTSCRDAHSPSTPLWRLSWLRALFPGMFREKSV